MKSYLLNSIIFDCVVQIREYLPGLLVIRAQTELQGPQELPGPPALMALWALPDRPGIQDLQAKLAPQDLPEPPHRVFNDNHGKPHEYRVFKKSKDN